VGIDDADTFKARIDYASSHCVGGTMIWSIDFDPEVGEKSVSNGTGNDLIYLDSLGRAKYSDTVLVSMYPRLTALA
jgi:GH18 family chitinase